jgi:mannose-6-phosphate isomerase-like protein (cupin superfamily)
MTAPAPAKNEVRKEWGVEHVICNEPEYCAKFLIIEPKMRCSLHYHRVKKETFWVKNGMVRLEQRDPRGVPIDELLAPGESRTIQPLTPHRFSSMLGAVILEVSTHHDDADVVRLEKSGACT